MKRLLAFLAAAFLASLATALPAFGQEAAEGLNLSPSRAEGIAAAGTAVGPFGLANNTSLRYRVRVLPVLIGQDRDGGIVVRDDAESLREAGRYLRPDANRFPLDPGDQESAGAILRRVPRSGSFYGGVLFETTPVEEGERQQILEILRLNASVLLDPLPGERRIGVSAGDVRGEQVGGRIELLTAATNEGNAYARASGTVRVLDQEGNQVARERLQSVEVLPDATVDLSAFLGRDLEAGVYPLEAEVEIGGESDRAEGELRVGADGRVVFEDAEITELRAPEAYEGEPVEVEATYRNTGNEAFAPQARVLVRPDEGGVPGDVVASAEPSVEETDFDEEGSIGGEVELPGGESLYHLEVELRAGERVLDSSSASVTVGERPGLGTRIADFITGNAVILVLALLAILLVGAGLVLRYVRQLRREAGRRP